MRPGTTAHLRLSCALRPVSAALFCSALHFAAAQDHHLPDSLEARLAELKAIDNGSVKAEPGILDSSTANALNRLGKAFMDSDTARAMECFLRELELSERIGYHLGVCRSLNNMASLNSRRSNFATSAGQLERSLVIAEKIGNRRIVKIDLLQLGQIRYHQGQYPEALAHLLEAHRMFKDDGEKKELSQVYNTLANVYQKVGNDLEALNMATSSLRIKEELGDTLGMALSYFNIGKLHYILNNEKMARESYEVALLLNQRKSNKRGIASCLREMSLLQVDDPDGSEALALAHKALALDEEIGNKQGIIGDQNSIALVHGRQGRNDLAVVFFKDALGLAEETRDVTMVASVCKGLSTSYEALGRYTEALEFHKRYTFFKDSLSSREASRRIAELQMRHDFDQQAAEARSEQAKKDLINREEVDRQKLVRNCFIGGFLLMVLFAGVFLRQRNRISEEKKTSETEKQRSDELLLNILPAEVAEELRRTGQCRPKTYSMATVLFADFKDFTKVSEKISAELLVNEIDACFKGFDAILGRHRIEKIKTVGDAYICASGLPSLNYTHATDMVEAAREIGAFMLARKAEKEARGEVAFELRIGIHTGPVVAGIVGSKKFSYDIWGDTVNLTARMEQSGEAGKINISGSTYELVKEKFSCTYRGKIHAKNKGDLDMYFIDCV